MVSTYGIVPKRRSPPPPVEKPTPVPSPAKAAARAKQAPPNRRSAITGLTPKQEAFVDAILRLGDPVRAYRAAYSAKTNDSTAHSHALKLLEHPRIQPLIQEAREKARMARGYTVDDALREAEEARRLAMDTDTPAAAVSAVNLKAKLLGLIVDKKEVTQKYEDMSPDQLEQRLQEMAARLGFELPDATTLRARLAPPDPRILDADFTEVHPADSTPAGRVGEGDPPQE